MANSSVASVVARHRYLSPTSAEEVRSRTALLESRPSLPSCTLYLRSYCACNQGVKNSFGLRSPPSKLHNVLNSRHSSSFSSRRKSLRSLSKSDQSQDILSETGASGKKVGVDVLDQEKGGFDREPRDLNGSKFSEASTSGSELPSEESLKNLEGFLQRVKNQVKIQKLDEDSPIASPDSILDTLLLISPFFLWGTAMVAMKGVLPKAGPMFVASVRLIPAGLLLIWFGASRGKKQPAGAMAWISIILFGLIDASCFQGFLAEGLKRTSAGLGSVIIDSQPLTVAILAALLFGESLGFINYAGLALGVLGLLFLEVPLDLLKNALASASDGSGLTGLIGDSSFLNEFASWDRGEWRMLLAAQSMAVGTVMVRWVCQYSDPFMATGWHMVLGGIPLLILSVIQQDPALSGHIQDLDANDWLALLYTSVAGSAISYGVFFYNATRGSLTKLSSLTFLTPMFAALFGFLFLNEVLTPAQFLGGFITLAGVLLVNYKPSPIVEVESDSDNQRKLP
ncbi:probable blue pigment (indigoidine) exporter [Marchantia polymorpha subsp. ruderalis]